MIDYYFGFIYRFYEGLIKRREQVGILRTCHVVFPGFLPPTLVDAIKPTPDELLLSTKNIDDSSEQFWRSIPTGEGVVVSIQGSSDGVRPFKTSKSSIRCIMGRYDNIYSPSSDKRIYIPDAPPFIIGIYKGICKDDDFVLRETVEEMLELHPPENGVLEKDIHCQFSVWIADGQERCYVCNTIHSSGYGSCPRCTQVGSTNLDVYQEHRFKRLLKGVKTGTTKRPKKPSNAVYFENPFPKVLRKDENWDEYKKILPGQVGIAHVYSVMVNSVL